MFLTLLLTSSLAAENNRSPAVTDIEIHSIGMKEKIPPYALGPVDLDQDFAKVAQRPALAAKKASLASNQRLASDYGKQAFTILFVLFALLSLPLVSFLAFPGVRDESDAVEMGDVEVLDFHRHKKQSAETEKLDSVSKAG